MRGTRRWLRAASLTGIVTVGVTLLVLFIGAASHWLDTALGIGTHRSSASKLVVMGIDGTGEHTLSDGPAMVYWSPSWFPDGQRMTYTIGAPGMPESQLAVAQADASDPQLVTDAQHGAYLAVWSPDGSRLAYISQTDADTRTAELIVIEADGSNPHQLTHNEAWEYGVSWSPDGRRLSYGSEQGEHWQVWVVNADGSHAHPLPGTEQGNAPDWSPDGQSIVFTSDRTGNDNLYVVAANGGTARRLTTDACHSDNPRWSPDGNQIVYAVFCPNQWNDIAVISVDGSQSHRLTQTSNQEEEVPAWLPDNQHIGFVRYQEEQDGLWPGPAFRALLFGLFLGLIVSGISVLRRLRKTTPKEETQNV